MLLTVFENSEKLMRAEVFDTKEGYRIDYYGPSGLLQSENFNGVSIHYVQDAAENWLQGIKKLNG